MTLPHDASSADDADREHLDKYRVEHPIERRLVDGFLRALDAVLPAGRAPTGARGRGRRRVRSPPGSASGYPTAIVVSIDLHDELLGTEWKGRGAIGAFADVRRLPFPDDAFDLVLGIEVLEHVPGLSGPSSRSAGWRATTVVLSVPREPIWRVANVAAGPLPARSWATRRVT